MKRIIYKTISLLLILILSGTAIPAFASTWTVYTTANSGLPHNTVRSVAFDQNNVQWFGTEGYAASFDGATWQTYSNVQNAHAAAVDPANNKWFGTYGGGLWKYDGNAWTSYTTANSGLPSNNVRSIAVDPADGTMWFGTGDCCSYANGLAHFDGTSWQTYTPFNSCLPDRTVLAIAVDDNGIKWLGTYGAGVVRFDGTNCVYYNSSNSPLPYNEVWDIALAADQTPWIGTGGGLAHFDGANWSVFTPANSPLPGGALVIEIDSSGNIWFGSESLVMYDGTSFTIYNTGNSPLPDNNVWELDFDTSGHLLIGTLSGAALYDPGSNAITLSAPYTNCSATSSHSPSPNPGDAKALSQGFSVASAACDASTGTLRSKLVVFGGTSNPYNAFQKNNPPSQQAQANTAILAQYTPDFTGNLQIKANLTLNGKEAAAAGSDLAVSINLQDEIGGTLLDWFSGKEISKLLSILNTLVKPTVAVGGTEVYLTVSGGSSGEIHTTLTGAGASFPLSPNSQTVLFDDQSATLLITVPVTQGQTINIAVGTKTRAQTWGWASAYVNLGESNPGVFVESVELARP